LVLPLLLYIIRRNISCAPIVANIIKNGSIGYVKRGDEKNAVCTIVITIIGMTSDAALILFRRFPKAAKASNKAGKRNPINSLVVVDL
jgi:hypothetical protein